MVLCDEVRGVAQLEGDRHLPGGGDSCARNLHRGPVRDRHVLEHDLGGGIGRQGDPFAVEDGAGDDRVGRPRDATDLVCGRKPRVNGSPRGQQDDHDDRAPTDHALRAHAAAVYSRCGFDPRQGPRSRQAPLRALRIASSDQSGCQQTAARSA